MTGSFVPEMMDVVHPLAGHCQRFRSIVPHAAQEEKQAGYCACTCVCTGYMTCVCLYTLYLKNYPCDCRHDANSYVLLLVDSILVVSSLCTT